MRVHIHSKHAYGLEKHAPHNVRALLHRTSELPPLLGPPVRGEYISLDNHDIGVHIHSKDAYELEKHVPHKIKAL